MVLVEEHAYHKDCVTLYPSGFVAFIDGEYLGETENDDGQMACEIIDDLLLDEEDEQGEGNETTSRSEQ